MSKGKRCFNLKFSTYYFQTKTKIFADFKNWKVKFKKKKKKKRNAAARSWPGKLNFYSYISLLVFTLTLKFEIWVSKFQIEKSNHENKRFLNLIFNERKAENKSCLLYVYLATKPLCWSKDKRTQTSGVPYHTAGKKSASRLLCNEITVIFSNKRCSATITAALSKKHTRKSEPGRRLYPWVHEDSF